MLTTLPVLMALSWVPAGSLPAPTQKAPAPTPQKADKATPAATTITCPITGEEIPSCCCPAKK